MLIENKGVIDDRERLDSILFLFSLCFPSFHLRRDSRGSIAYSEELISSTISVTLQSTDRHHGIVGQERCHN